MREQIVVGNWKMNTDLDEAINLLVDIKEILPHDRKTVVCVPYTHIAIADELALETGIHVGAQNLSDKESGAYTGEISAKMLSSLGVTFVIVGHSERRQIFNESDALVAAKLKQALSSEIIPIFCCGEPLDVRKSDKHLTYIKSQLENGLFHLSAEEVNDTILAYEPIWAIGTGETASPQQAQEVHHFIRQQLKEKYGNEVAENISILYGGSVKPNNAKELFSQEDIDGGLVGGASLNAEDFVAIINSI